MVPATANIFLNSLSNLHEIIRVQKWSFVDKKGSKMDQNLKSEF